jgi:hypothetical protein
MVNAAFFHKINPNYSRSCIIEPAKQNSLDNIFFRGDDSSINKIDKIISSRKELTELEEHELIICCPTVPGFSFGDKLWCNNFPLPMGPKMDSLLYAILGFLLRNRFVSPLWIRQTDT